MQTDKKKERGKSMIVKYRKGNIWGYVDNIRNVEKDEIDISELVNDFNKIPNEKEPIECYMDGKRLEESICIVNKAFTMATMRIKDNEYYSHMENLLNNNMLDMPAVIITMHMEEHSKEYEELIFVTNEQVYLMNDKGQTIERLN